VKRVGVTQRVDHIESYNEFRDCLDQRWSDLLEELGAICVPLPNLRPSLVDKLLGSLELDAVIFSGGNSLTCVDPSAFDASDRRDQFESALLNACLANGTPVLGVCRGMQHINVELGGALVKVEGHVATRHTIVGNSMTAFPKEVNSYHTWAIAQQGLAPGLIALASDVDGNVEAFEHDSAKLRGVMWHPEREAKPNDYDLELIQELLI
jgi:N5-(cytidine 5'-diphosphoramidyl)-L-glutamine hydrolase